MLRRPILATALAALILAPSAYIGWSLRDMPQFGRMADDGIYYATAQSLAQGHGYRIASLPGQPYQAKYPPLYPLALSVIWRLNPEFPANLQIAAAFAWLMLPAL